MVAVSKIFAKTRFKNLTEATANLMHVRGMLSKSKKALRLWDSVIDSAEVTKNSVLKIGGKSADKAFDLMKRGSWKEFRKLMAGKSDSLKDFTNKDLEDAFRAVNDLDVQKRATTAASKQTERLVDKLKLKAGDIRDVAVAGPEAVAKRHSMFRSALAKTGRIATKKGHKVVALAGGVTLVALGASYVREYAKELSGCYRYDGLSLLNGSCKVKNLSCCSDNDGKHGSVAYCDDGGVGGNEIGRAHV